MKKILLLTLLLLFSCSKEASEPEIIRYTLTVTANPPEGGLVNPQTGTYIAGQSVNIVASANDFFIFKDWTGNWNGSDPEFTITMDGDKNITAIFMKDSDEDGVADLNDSCPNSSGNVDEVGCADFQKDDDNDGIDNSIDLCPNTSINPVVEVDGNGCKINYIYVDNGIIKSYPGTPIGKQDILSDIPGNPFFDLNNEETIFTVVSRENLIDDWIPNGKDVSYAVVSNLTDMSNLFSKSFYYNRGITFDTSELNRNGNPGNPPIGNISAWDVSNVINMEAMFVENPYAESLNIGLWNVSNLKNMKFMFWMSNFGTGDSNLSSIGNWDVSSVINMRAAFSSTDFNQDISNWDVSSVETMEKMFASSIFDQPLNEWDVSSVKNMRYMFFMSIFNQPLNNWDVSNVIDMLMMFRSNKIFNQDISMWNTQESTTNATADRWNGNCFFFAFDTSEEWPHSFKPDFSPCNPRYNWPD